MAGEYHLRLINFGISDGDAPENSIIYVRKGLHSPIEACISAKQHEEVMECEEESLEISEFGDYEAHQIQDLMAELMQHVNEAERDLDENEKKQFVFNKLNALTIWF